MYLCILNTLSDVHGNRSVQAKVFVDNSIQVGHVINGIMIQMPIVLLKDLLNFVVETFL